MKEGNSKRAESEVQAGSWGPEDVFPGITSNNVHLLTTVYVPGHSTFTLTQKTLMIML